MKRLLFIPLIFLCSALWAGDSCKEPVQLARMNPYIAGAGVSAAATYLLSEDFDGSSTCYTGDSTYVNCNTPAAKWTLAGFSGSGSVNFKYSTSPAPLGGTYSAYLQNEHAYNDGTIVASITASDTVGVYAIVNFPTASLEAGYTKPFIRIRNGTTDLCAAALYQSSEQFAVLSEGAENHSGGVSYSATTTYHVWLEWTKATSGDGICRLYVGANDSTKTLAGGFTNRTSTSQGDKLMVNILHSTTTDYSLIIDKIRVNNAVIGVSPE